MHHSNSHFPQVPAEAIAPERLEWLCQPERLEETLRTLFWLGAWKNTAHTLLYADRQGLQKVQALVLLWALRTHKIRAVAYLTGQLHFPDQLRLASAADEAARGILLHLKSLNDPDLWPHFSPEGDRVYQQFLRPLYRRITGQTFQRAEEALPALTQLQLQGYLQEHLQALVTRAQHIRQPIPLRQLTRLCIAPVDLLPIRENRLYFFDGYDTWKDLDESDLRKLDPEGTSEIVVQYRSATASFVFHLPYRQAEQVLSPAQLRTFRRKPGRSQEQAIWQGHLLDAAEGLTQPVHLLLENLGVVPATVCPHGLVDKTQYLAQPTLHDLLWPTRGDDPQAWLDDPWDGLCLPPQQR